MPLLLPRSAADERLRINSEIKSQVYAEHAAHWTEELRRIDPSLEVGRASENADDPELVPGAWYLIKHIPTSVDAYIQLPRPPGAWMFDWLSANDLWNPRVHRSKKEAKEKFRAAKNRGRKLEEEQRRDEMASAYDAAKRLRGDSGMTQRTDLKGKPTEHSYDKG